MTKRLIIYLITAVFFLIIYGWVNLRCPGELGGDNKKCYFLMASALIDNDPNTKYDTDYWYGRGVIFPLLYALTWKVIYSPGGAFDFNTFINYQAPPISLFWGAFFMVFALFVFLALTLKIKHVTAFILAMGFYLQIDPFFEIMNNGFIDSFYLFITAIGMYFLARGIIEENLIDFCILGIIWFLLPMVRANGAFIIMWTVLALVIKFLMNVKDMGKINKLIKQSLMLVLIFAICNIIYELIVFSLDWQPSSHIIKHHPLILMVVPSMHLSFGWDGKGEGLETFNYFVNIKSLAQFFAFVKQFLSAVVSNIHHMFNKTSGAIFGNNIWDYNHCLNKPLHLLHGNCRICEPFIIGANIIFLVYQIKRRDKAVLLMYLGVFCWLLLMSLFHYEARYYVLVFFVFFYPFFWLLDQGIGMLKKYKTTPTLPIIH